MAREQEGMTSRISNNDTHEEILLALQEVKTPLSSIHFGLRLIVTKIQISSKEDLIKSYGNWSLLWPCQLIQTVQRQALTVGAQLAEIPHAGVRGFR